MLPKRLYLFTSEANSNGAAQERPLHAFLTTRGIEVRLLVWDRDPLPPLEKGEFAIVRSIWDYLEKPDQFRRWLDGLPTLGVYNSPGILRWNSDKTYLRGLEAVGVRLVPTRWLNARTESEVQDFVFGSFPGRRLIVKPLWSAGARHTYRLEPGEAPPRDIFEGLPAMVQPYLSEIESDGERSLVYFSGEFSHGVRKLPRPGDFRIQEIYGGVFSAFFPQANELGFGAQVMRAIRSKFSEEQPPLYSRIDYLLVEGVPHLMEAELLEPDLYFHHAPKAAEHFLDALDRL